MEQEARLAAFEAMLTAVRERYAACTEQMRLLRTQGKEKTASYRQLMGERLQYRSMLSLYLVYGLLDESERTAEP